MPVDEATLLIVRSDEPPIVVMERSPVVVMPVLVSD
jgi:hypothetical protein